MLQLCNVHERATDRSISTISGISCELVDDINGANFSRLLNGFVSTVMGDKS